MQLAAEKIRQENQQPLQLRIKKLKAAPLQERFYLLEKQPLQPPKELITILKGTLIKNLSQISQRSPALNQITTVNLTRRKRKKPEKESLKPK